MSLNKTLLIGHLGADPESRTTPSGSIVVTLRLATTERVKSGEEWQEHTEWHRVVCFGRTAENVAKFCAKGKQLYIEGRLRTREWEKDGVKRYSTEIIADVVQFLGGGARDGGGQSDPYRAAKSGYGEAKAKAKGPDDDIPF